jgi:hypothetical protein
MAGRSPPGPTCSHQAGGQAHTFVDSGTLALTSMTAPGIVGADMAHVAHGLPPNDLDSWRQHPFDAARFIFKALQASRPMVGPIIVQETGVALGHLVEGLIPGLLMAVGVLGATTVLGTVVGGAVGAFAGGFGAAPGAALGGQLGFDIGMAALAWMGLAFIVASLGQGLPKLNQQAELGIKRAVHAMNLPPPARPAEMLEASRHFAQAQALLFKLILMGLVAWLLKKGAVSSAQQVGNSARAISGASKAGTSVEAAEAGVAELVAQLRKSQLGNGFADWVEGNWRQLIENPKLRPQTAVKAVTNREAEVVTPSQLAKMRNSAAHNKVTREQPTELAENTAPTKSNKYSRRSEAKRIPAEEVNATYPEGWAPPYKPGTMATEFTTTTDEVFARVHGENNMARSWMMKREAIEGLSPAEIKSKYALPELPTKISEVHVPAGTNVRTGTVNPVFGGKGNATQYELLERLPASAFKNTTPLQP